MINPRARSWKRTPYKYIPVLEHLRYLDDGCDELLQERVFQERRPVVMEKVDEKSFDVGAILILVQHTS